MRRAGGGAREGDCDALNHETRSAEARALNSRIPAPARMAPATIADIE
jgi:hypothetical protein